MKIMLYFCKNLNANRMKKSLFFFLIIVVSMMLFSTGCTDKKSVDADTIVTDTMLSDSLGSDSLDNIIAEQPMPKAADELFDDFVFNFAANKRVQKERTDFPLIMESYGKSSTIDLRSWTMEHFFMRQGYYTLVFNSEKQKTIVKDTSVSNVYVEKISYAQNSVKRWMFNRIDGLWRLQKVSVFPLAKHEDAEFLTFYNAFASDSTMQMQSLASDVTFSGPDPDDDFSRMEGQLMPEQWPMFAPWMPSQTIYNIHYGSMPYKKSNRRLFIIRGVANGLETELIFEEQNHKWVLTRFES